MKQYLITVITYLISSSLKSELKEVTRDLSTKEAFSCTPLCDVYFFSVFTEVFMQNNEIHIFNFQQIVEIIIQIIKINFQL